MTDWPKPEDLHTLIDHQLPDRSLPCPQHRIELVFSSPLIQAASINSPLEKHFGMPPYNFPSGFLIRLRAPWGEQRADSRAHSLAKPSSPMLSSPETTSAAKHCHSDVPTACTQIPDRLPTHTHASFCCFACLMNNVNNFPSLKVNWVAVEARCAMTRVQP